MMLLKVPVLVQLSPTALLVLIVLASAVMLAVLFQVSVKSSVPPVFACSVPLLVKLRTVTVCPLAVTVAPAWIVVVRVLFVLPTIPPVVPLLMLTPAPIVKIVEHHR